MWQYIDAENVDLRESLREAGLLWWKSKTSISPEWRVAQRSGASRRVYDNLLYAVLLEE